MATTTSNPELAKTLAALREQIVQGVSTVKLFEHYVAVALDIKKQPAKPAPATTTTTNKKKSSISNDLLDTQLDNPLDAIADLAKLTKAHATKLAIAFKPPIAVEVASKCFGDSVGLMAPMFGALASTTAATNSKSKQASKQKKLPSIVISELKTHVLEYYAASRAFYTELASLALAQEKQEKENRTQDDAQLKKSNNIRFLNTGKVWHACDVLSKAPTTSLSAAKLLASKVMMYADVIQDAADELDEAAADEFGEWDEGYESDGIVGNDQASTSTSTTTANASANTNNGTPYDIVVMDGPVSEPLDSQTAQAYDKMVHKKVTSSAKVESRSSFSSSSNRPDISSLQPASNTKEEEEEEEEEEKEEKHDDEENETVLALKYKTIISQIPAYLKTSLIGLLRDVHKAEMLQEQQQQQQQNQHSNSTAPNDDDSEIYDTLHALLKALSASVDDLAVYAVYDPDQELCQEAGDKVINQLQDIQSIVDKKRKSLNNDTEKKNPDLRVNDIVQGIQKLVI